MFLTPFRKRSGTRLTLSAGNLLMQILSLFPVRWALFCLMLLGNSNLLQIAFADDNPRYTPLVQAVQECRKSVVNLRGRKTVPDTADKGDSQRVKQVNGMGTGVVIDSRGYILTNYHVVQGVKEIEVTTSENEKTTAVILAHDPLTDLAILKVDLKRPLPKIKIGSSSDLMLAETVTAVGNAYGYEHTVTVGIISQIGRTVPVNDQQVYKNLIQTDAAINPGNSGGPLLNMNGEMIGINVAVRVGAQGIAFAIPVNDAMEVAARLMATLIADELYHGVVTSTVFVNHQPQVIVKGVEPNSPAAKSGIKVGDRILSVNGTPITFEAEFQACCVGLEPSETVELRVLHEENQDMEVVVALPLETRSGINPEMAWELLGVRVVPCASDELSNVHPDYNQGLRVTQVRAGSPAANEGLVPGDIIVAMHGYKIESLENLYFVLATPEVSSREKFMFYILRGKTPYYGQMRVSQVKSQIR
jgi:serine protease Do